MTLTLEDLQKLARLSQLALTPAQAEALLPELQSILNWVGSLSEAPTEGVEPMSHPHDPHLRLRADLPQALASRDELMANAPSQAVGHFLVPRVVE
ncbi:MAG: Asp-tRNA(Asn)/Glu-tRNA(Gln) amidotransferase subunit GatC [Burkholderiaceae bacterium]|jgi:aspartyl-tRNA(Asn)/glutamyl-tRNA(Gln) amidotransferase subunit C